MNPGIVSLTGDKAQGDDSKQCANSNPANLFLFIKCLFAYKMSPAYYVCYIHPNALQTDCTLNKEIFARISFSRIELKDLLSMLKIRDIGMIYLHRKRTKRFRHFARVLISRNSASEKFRENKTIAKISEYLQYRESKHYEPIATTEPS